MFTGLVIIAAVAVTARTSGTGRGGTAPDTPGQEATVRRNGQAHADYRRTPHGD
jgi:hypothetical protein